MGNRELKSQVLVEFALGFIIILTLFLGGFRVWSSLNNTLVGETTQYQKDRVAAGQGDKIIPGFPSVDANMRQLDDAMLDKIQKIQMCTCITDTLKQRAIDVYTKQYEYDLKVKAYEDVVKGLKDSITALQNAYDAIPWCSKCCSCEIKCRGNCLQLQDDGDGNMTCVRYATISVWMTCSGSASNPCRTCPNCGGFMFYGTCFYCPEDDREGNPTRRCVSIKPNMGDPHSQYRKQISDGIKQTKKDLKVNEKLLADYKANKAYYDTRAKQMDGVVACCGVI